MSASRRKGSAWETAIVDYLRANGVPHAERRVPNGAKDRGDIAGLPGVVIEAKSAGRTELGLWVNEAEAERRNDNHAPVAVVWHKRKGKTSPGEAYVTMTGAQLVNLLRTAGYIPESLDPLPRGAEPGSPPRDGARDKLPPEWAVDHPGLGVYPYDTEDEARQAAGTAGILLYNGWPVH